MSTFWSFIKSFFSYPYMRIFPRVPRKINRIFNSWTGVPWRDYTNLPRDLRTEQRQILASRKETIRLAVVAIPYLVSQFLFFIAPILFIASIHTFVIMAAIYYIVVLPWPYSLLLILPFVFLFIRKITQWNGFDIPNSPQSNLDDLINRANRLMEETERIENNTRALTEITPITPRPPRPRNTRTPAIGLVTPGQRATIARAVANQNNPRTRTFDDILDDIFDDMLNYDRRPRPRRPGVNDPLSTWTSYYERDRETTRPSDMDEDWS